MTKYKFFWGGIYSNFHPSTFRENNINYSCNEQYFMHRKALHFEDYDIATELLHTTDPKECKKLGRQVKGFDPIEWDRVKEHYMYEGLKLKFTQNPDLKEALLKENCDLFVEASPFDKIWGIGLNAEDARKTPESEWPGQNLLGKLLTQLREELKGI